MVAASRIKNLRGPRDTAGPQPPSKQRSRVMELEERIEVLMKENRELRINQIVDLRVASGLISESERNKSQLATAKLGDEALKVIRQDLLTFLSRLNAAAKSSADMQHLSYVM